MYGIITLSDSYAGLDGDIDGGQLQKALETID